MTHEEAFAALVADPADYPQLFPPVGATITTDQLADLLDLTPTRVQTLVRQGIIPQTSRGRYDRRDAVRAYSADMRKRAAGRGSANPEWTAAKTRAAEAQAVKLETANALARGDLLSAADVKAEWALILTDVRAAMLAVPSRLPELDRAAVARVDAEIRAALEGLSNG
ncbi:phage terminase Nu1 subunit (DNA packaging protein) [Methylopila capsulata]|uniref:Phage terminase Nu1 subunit (DNA packaging protein) n=1 Tax=Methylopila capsulata TaxID=61654 RepID=A0A9W6IS32_9HYPH|nr:hypothetical protein [Methylopila capsulata]MBM7851281.1 phage terminase Nu1 subunit (DNA packaging protein) [Methylopila capsulata]GLK54339.1 hypothetical protein GCM10008170_03580 [Methylopila capsulata]